MTIINAKRYIQIYQNEEKFRLYLMNMKTPDEVRSFLKVLELDFTDEEFQEAYTLSVAKCQSERAHNLLTEVKHCYISLITQ